MGVEAASLAASQALLKRTGECDRRVTPRPVSDLFAIPIFNKESQASAPRTPGCPSRTRTWPPGASPESNEAFLRNDTEDRLRDQRTSLAATLTQGLPSLFSTDQLGPTRAAPRVTALPRNGLRRMLASPAAPLPEASRCPSRPGWGPHLTPPRPCPPGRAPGSAGSSSPRRSTSLST